MSAFLLHTVILGVPPSRLTSWGREMPVIVPVPKFGSKGMALEVIFVTMSVL